MKKFFLFAAALCAAFTLNAKEIVVDLSSGAKVGCDECSAALVYAAGVATINWTVVENWEVAGIEYSLDNLDVTSFSYEVKGDGQDFGFIAYLRDSEGYRWFHADWISLAVEEWTAKNATDFDSLWDDQKSEDFGKNPMISIGFIANPGYDTDIPDPFNVTGSFAVRNLKLTVTDEATAVDNVASEIKTTKVIRDGQILILRDGRTFNALGAEIK